MPRHPLPALSPRAPARVALLLAAALAAGCDRAAPPVSPEATPPPDARRVVVVGDVHSTDWSEYASGVQPAGWSQVWDPTPHFRVGDAPGATGGKTLQWSATGQSRNRWGLAYDGAGNVADQEVYTEFRVRSLGAGTSVWYMGSAAVRMTGTATDEGGYAVWFIATSSQRSLALSTWTGGAYVQLATLPFAWADDTWYAVRLRAVGTQIEARVWPRGTPEPAAWTMSAVDSRWPVGKPGVSHHDNGSVEWDVWRATLLSPAPPPPPPPPPGSAPTLQTTFATGIVGAAPDGWTETAYPANSAWTLAEDSTADDGRVLRNVTTATGRHILRLDAVPDSTTTQEVLVKMRLADSDARGPGVALRHRMNGANETAYVAYFRPALDQVEINRFLEGGWAFVGARSFANDPGVWYWLRFRAEGTALRLRVWADGTPEPAAWMLEVNNAEIASGSLGLYTYEANTVDYDGFSAALGGGTAPVPTAPIPPHADLVGMVASPDSTTLTPGATVQFHAWGLSSDGTPLLVIPAWSASGGSITSDGLFTAGGAPGRFPVVAREPVTGVADTAWVTVAAPAAVSLALSPAGAMLQPGGTAQFTATATWSDGSTGPAPVSWSATGGSVSPSGLYTAGGAGGSFHVVAATAGGAADTAEVTILPPPPPPPPGGARWFTDFSTGTVGRPMPDLRKVRSTWEWNYLLTVRADASATGGRVLRLEGSGTVNAGSRPHAWLVVPVADEQEVVVRLRATDVSRPAGGAFVGASIDADNQPTEYGASLTKGRFQLWNYRRGGFNRVDVAAPLWTANQWTWVRLRKTATQVMARYWPDGQPEPAAWTLVQNRDFGPNGGAATVGPGMAGLYANTVQSGVEFDVMGAAIDGAEAPTSGSPVVGTLPPVVTTAPLVATGFQDDATGQPPAGWTPEGTTTGVSWNVTEVGGGNRAIRSTGSGNAHRLLTLDALGEATTDQEVLVRVRPATTGSMYTVGAALRVMPAPGGADSFYAFTLGSQSINYFRVVNGVRTVLESTGVRFDYAAGEWYWLRARVVGDALMARAWRVDEPEPASWFKVRTDGSLPTGGAGLYHWQGDTVELDDVAVRAH